MKNLYKFLIFAVLVSGTAYAANKTLPTLTAASGVAGTDLLLVREGADTEDNKATFAQVKAYLEGNLASTTLAGTLTQTSNSASAIISGPNGATNPVLTVSNNTASQASGLQILGKAAGASVDLIATSSGSTENVRILGKGSTGGVQLGGNSSTVTTILPYAVTTALGTNSNAGSSWVRFKVTGAANTSLTTTQEHTSVFYDFSQTNTHATGAITTQRDFRIACPAHAFAASSTITERTCLSIDTLPAAGANATITDEYSIQTGNNIKVPGVQLVVTTVALLGTAKAGLLKAVSDASSGTDCTSGGGSTYNLCMGNGSIWIDM